MVRRFVFRYKALGDGSRQILSFLVAGDIYDTQHFILPEADYSICTLTSCRVASVPHHEITKLVERFPRIARALWKETLLKLRYFGNG
jgi:CRP-like cAMP-binding protein